MIINEAGDYTLQYTATDSCGNTTNVLRELTVEEPPTYRTVLYTDGTFIINESSRDEAANVALHGVATNVYYPLDASHNYVFASTSERPWYTQRTSIVSVEIGSEIKPTSTAFWFDGFTQCTNINLINLDTSIVTNMKNMFSSCTLAVFDVSDFETSLVTDMSNMFMGCRALTSLDVSGFNTSLVTSMSGMFNDCRALTSLDVSGFDTSSVTNMKRMFYYCQSITSLDLSNFTTSIVEDMEQMFSNCSSLTSLNVGSFNTSTVTTMRSMFSTCSVLTELDLSSFDTSSVTDMSNMFSGCGALTTIYASANFIVTQVTSSSNMFQTCSVLVGGAGTTYNSSYKDKTRAKIDGGTSDPGYFTAKS